MTSPSAFSGARRVPSPVNEQSPDYRPGSGERATLKDALSRMAGERVDIPLFIGGREVRTGRTRDVVAPHDYRRSLGVCHLGGPAEVQAAIAAAAEARAEWAAWAPADRAAVFLRAAELLATSWRQTLNAATMLGQSKTLWQAEIDAAAELIDFWRFNPHFAARLQAEQPNNSPGAWNQLDYRPLEGFVYAVSPFNFTSIAGNLPTSPALMGNVVIWKPASTAMLSAYYLYRLLEEAGLPPGVINMVAGEAAEVSEVVLASPDLAGVHFTGSTAVFDQIWQVVGNGVASARYRSYPRLVGETGGKDFIVSHSSADPEALATAIVRGGFEHQGQKCSAVSRIYVPRSLWSEVRDRTVAMIERLRIGAPTDFRTFMAAVIDRPALDRISGYLTDARAHASVLTGGGVDDAVGYFVDPTLVETTDPASRLLREEVFGPVVTALVYDDAMWDATLRIVDATSPYALTGAVFARDRRAIRDATSALRNAAGNFYINDKPTGAVVGQQPFGGARRSGTNDKAGSMLNLARWVSARNVKETFTPPRDFLYPYMSEE